MATKITANPLLNQCYPGCGKLAINSFFLGGGGMRFANRYRCIVKWLTSTDEDYMYKQKVFIFYVIYDWTISGEGGEREINKSSLIIFIDHFICNLLVRFHNWKGLMGKIIRTFLARRTFYNLTKQNPIAL